MEIPFKTIWLCLVVGGVAWGQSPGPLESAKKLFEDFPAETRASVARKKWEKELKGTCRRPEGGRGGDVVCVAGKLPSKKIRAARLVLDEHAHSIVELTVEFKDGALKGVPREKVLAGLPYPLDADRKIASDTDIRSVPTYFGKYGLGFLGKQGLSSISRETPVGPTKGGKFLVPIYCTTEMAALTARANSGAEGRAEAQAAKVEIKAGVSLRVECSDTEKRLIFEVEGKSAAPMNKKYWFDRVVDFLPRLPANQQDGAVFKEIADIIREDLKSYPQRLPDWVEATQDAQFRYGTFSVEAYKISDKPLVHGLEVTWTQESD